MSEMIAGMTVFVIVYGSIIASLSVNDSSFLLKQKEANMAATYQEVYWYMYAYKKNFGTNLFKQNLLNWMSTNCTSTINATDTNGGSWCALFPYYNGWELKFSSAGSFSTTSAPNGSERYYSSVTSDQTSYIWSNRLPSTYKQIIVYVRQDSVTEDTFYVRFRILDVAETSLPSGKTYTNFDQSFEIY